MIFEAMLFYLFAAVMIGAALGVVFARNPVHSVMFLVLTFFNSAILWLMAEAEFLAIVLVLVYVGAVMVLFLFVIMMLEVNVEAVKRGLTRYAPLAIAIALIIRLQRTRRATTTPRRSVRCSIPSTCTPSRSRPSSCCLRSSRR
jgi:NADH-quinone oxidoreductase subunit J